MWLLTTILLSQSERKAETGLNFKSSLTKRIQHNCKRKDMCVISEPLISNLGTRKTITNKEEIKTCLSLSSPSLAAFAVKR